MRAAAAAAACFAALIAGCGSGGDDRLSATAEIRSVVNGFTAALGSGDAKAACARYDQRQFRGLPDDFGCEALFGGSSAFWRSFLTAKVERIVIDGARASVGLSNDEILRLAKRNGTWVVSDLGGAANSIGG